MNVYDFDGTIYYKNTSIDFAFWCMNRHPSLYFTYSWQVLRAYILYKRGKLANYQLLRKLFSFLTKVKDLDIQIERYWDKNESKISAWYLAQKKPDDLIITASPACIIAPIAERLGVNCVASEYDPESGVFVNNLMYAKEKARYIFDHDFPKIENFYSDSLSDTPLALCAEKAYLVTDSASKLNDWPEMDKETVEEVKKMIDTGWSVHLD
ncbi:MAG: haloacid dehalogenase-like hydrolase [Clostridia bacterium]|nr:haloacid dehalogenase-like hydrolase [Clostridia bacterium]